MGKITYSVVDMGRPVFHPLLDEIMGLCYKAAQHSHSLFKHQTDKPESYEDFRKRMLEPYSLTQEWKFFIASCAGKIVGISSITIYKGFDAVRLGHVFVKADYRRRGIAKHLLRTIMKKYHDRSFMLTVFNNNSGAKELYLSLGFDVNASFSEMYFRREK
jgi:ribosomal protein S18 acetylase RimI-like enzyme